MRKVLRLQKIKALSEGPIEASFQISALSNVCSTRSGACN